MYENTQLQYPYDNPMSNRYCYSFLFFINSEYNVISQYNFDLKHPPVTEINFLTYVCGHLNFPF